MRTQKLKKVPMGTRSPKWGPMWLQCSWPPPTHPPTDKVLKITFFGGGSLRKFWNVFLTIPLNQLCNQTQNAKITSKSRPPFTKSSKKSQFFLIRKFRIGRDPPLPFRWFSKKIFLVPPLNIGLFSFTINYLMDCNILISLPPERKSLTIASKNIWHQVGPPIRA